VAIYEMSSGSHGNDAAADGVEGIGFRSRKGTFFLAAANKHGGTGIFIRGCPSEKKNIPPLGLSVV
jgi:hypothetical protein